MTPEQFASVRARSGDWLLIDTHQKSDTVVTQYAGLVRLGTDLAINGSYPLARCKDVRKFDINKLRKIIDDEKKSTEQHKGAGKAGKPAARNERRKNSTSDAATVSQKRRRKVRA